MVSKEKQGMSVFLVSVCEGQRAPFTDVFMLHLINYYKLLVLVFLMYLELDIQILRCAYIKI